MVVNGGYHERLYWSVVMCGFQAQAAALTLSGVCSSAIAASFSSMLLRTSGLVSGLTFLGLYQKEMNVS